ncbi:MULTISPECIES: hypothetical protein [unclassified Rhizobium]|uniref:hypothetical protein n=1 Tax=unclassified Rhizobium TaxID=2613769 RepID=UPI001ADD4153|nr:MULTISPECIES: hypothetical protein [unclassified Rhizobium]MBO9126922.1 hypothetical protein [Rhizobium sp. 16-488-2b]MBO9177370.1 hypothetical protein [Rhizobium sp. 16-488-2a]
MYIENMFSEIEQRLEPLAKVLGLEPHRDVRGPYYRLSYRQAGDEDWRSPVTIMFPFEELTGKVEADWEDAHLGIDEFAVFPIGTNGWVAHQGAGRTIVPISGSSEAVINEFAKCLRQHELRPYGKDMLSIPNSEAMVDAWKLLSQTFDEASIEDVDLYRDETGESLSFELGDHEFVLFYPVEASKAVLYVDGVPSREVPSRDIRAVDSMVSWQLGEVQFDLMCSGSDYSP